ncbi:MAG: hypothetical protein IKK52_00460 [Alphaproteobacteria bacterium]|nr:hypothetical protein [Alphaproteobacteria bacterium]
MLRFKKIVYFVLGLLVVPLLLGGVFALLNTTDYNTAYNFFGGTYLINYLLFPLCYKSKIKQKITNKYIAYLLLYLPFIALFLYCKL